MEKVHSYDAEHVKYILKYYRNLSYFVKSFHPVRYYMTENLIWVYFDEEISTNFNKHYLCTYSSYIQYLRNVEDPQEKNKHMDILYFLKDEAENYTGIIWKNRDFKQFLLSHSLDKPLHALRSKSYQAARRAIPKIIAQDLVSSMESYDTYFANKVRQQCITELSKSLVLKK